MIRRAVAIAVALAAICVVVPLAGDPRVSSAAPATFGRLHREFQPTDGKLFILVIGNDARSGNPDASRADALHIVGVNTQKMRGGILNFPRDSWVSIPGYGSGKINEALYDGGPELVARTLENLTGIRLDYWVMTGFEGFQEIVDGVGGVKMRIPQDVYDPTGSGAKIDKGLQNLGPKDALAYVRTRHNFAGGDIARSEHQADFMIAMMKKLTRQSERDPATVLRWMSLGRQHTRSDLSADEMFRLGVLASQLPATQMGNVTVPVSVGAVGAASVVFISPGARSIYQRFRSNGYL